MSSRAYGTVLSVIASVTGGGAVTAFFSPNVDPRWMLALAFVTLVLLVAMVVALSYPEHGRGGSEASSLRIEFPDPIREIRYHAAGSEVTPSWALDVLLMAEVQPLDIIDIYISQEGVGRWTTEEITTPSGQRVYTPLRVVRSLRIQVRATSPQKGSIMPLAIRGLSLVAQDHHGRSHAVRFSEWSRGAQLSATPVTDDSRQSGRLGPLLWRKIRWFALPAGVVAVTTVLGYGQLKLGWGVFDAYRVRIASPKQEARLIPVVHRVQFAKRAEGEYLAIIYATLRNAGEGEAKNVLLRHQHRAGQWTGVVEWLDRFHIPPGRELPIRFSADTFADPRGSILRGERTYFVLRADWDNADGEPGCGRFFVEYIVAPGADIAEIAIVPTIREDIPASVKQGLSLSECAK